MNLKNRDALLTAPASGAQFCDLAAWTAAASKCTGTVSTHPSGSCGLTAGSL